MILPLYPALVRPHLGTLCPFLGSLVQEIHEFTGESPGKGRKFIKGLEHPSSEERLRELELFSPERRWPRGILSMCRAT